MAKENKDKILCRLKDIEIVNEDYDQIHATIKTNKSEPEPFSSAINIDMNPIEDRNEVEVVTSLTFRFKGNKPFAKLVVKNTFHVEELHQLLETVDGKPTIANNEFTLFLVDACIGHLRALQAYRMKAYPEIPIVPFLPRQHLKLPKKTKA